MLSNKIFFLNYLFQHAIKSRMPLHQQHRQSREPYY